MIIKGSPIVEIIAAVIILFLNIFQLINSYISPFTFLVGILFGCGFILFLYSQAAYYFIIENDTIIVRNYIKRRINHNYYFREIEIIKIVDSIGTGVIIIKINSNRYMLRGRRYDVIKKEFYKLKLEGINVIAS